MPKITFDNNFHTPNDKENCQLFIGLTGTKEFIVKKLQLTLEEINSSYGKPCQGVYLEPDGTKEIITPIWGGRKF